MHDEFFAFIFQNLVLEERNDIRDLSFDAFAAAVAEVDGEAGALDSTVEPYVEDWYGMVMTPIGAPLEENLFVGKRRAGHNVDKHVMAGDMSLISTDSLLRSRIAAAKGLALLRRYQMTEVGRSAEALLMLRSQTWTCCADT